MSENKFTVECAVCKTRIDNWVGSTPCCGSVAYLVEDEVVTNKISLFASVGGSKVKPTIFKLVYDDKFQK